FKAPPPGGRHIFRKGEPYAQVIFIPQRVSYELTRMTSEEEKYRRDLAWRVDLARSQIGTNIWANAGGAEQNNYYKVLASAFAKEGMDGVEKLVREAMDKHEGL